MEGDEQWLGTVRAMMLLWPEARNHGALGGQGRPVLWPSGNRARCRGARANDRMGVCMAGEGALGWLAKEHWGFIPRLVSRRTWPCLQWLFGLLGTGQGWREATGWEIGLDGAVSPVHGVLVPIQILI